MQCESEQPRKQVCAFQDDIETLESLEALLFCLPRLEQKLENPEGGVTTGLEERKTGNCHGARWISRSRLQQKSVPVSFLYLPASTFNSTLVFSDQLSVDVKYLSQRSSDRRFSSQCCTIIEAPFISTPVNVKAWDNFVIGNKWPDKIMRLKKVVIFFLPHTPILHTVLYKQKEIILSQTPLKVSNYKCRGTF